MAYKQLRDEMLAQHPQAFTTDAAEARSRTPESYVERFGAERPEGGMELDSRFFLQSDGMRPHQVRLQGGDASSDSYCTPE